MLAAKTLKRYIQRCDELLKNPSNEAAEILVSEIVSVLQTDIEGLVYNLEAYGPYSEGSVTDYVADLRLLRARLQKELDVIEPNTEPGGELHNRNRKIFISHATKDKDYVEAIVNLLEALGFHEDEIICSSIPPYCVPLDNNVFSWLVNEFQHSDLHVIFVLSKTYYTRPVCLNEMGAAWALKHRWTAILLPGFGFDEITGCIDPAQVSIKLDDADRDTLNYRLSELKDNLVAEFGLRDISQALWEKKRKEFLSKVEEVIHKDSKEMPKKETADNTTTKATLEKDEGILLIYAASDPAGQILMIGDITRSGTSITTHGVDFTIKDTAREYARWKAAVEKLERYNLIQATNYKREVFKVTAQGYKVADAAKEQWSIDTAKSPRAYLDD